MAQPRLAIVTISFNTKALLKQCLQSLQNLSDMTWGEDFEVIVAENDSKDDSLEMITQDFPEAKLVDNKANVGFSRGNNSAIPHLSDSIEYVLFLNSDTVVPDGTLSHMVRFMDERPDVGVSTCKVMLFSGKIDLDCHRGLPTPWASFTKLTKLYTLAPRSSFLNPYYLGHKDLETTHEVDSVVGAFMLVPRHVGDQINWWDEDFFLNGEDIDFCYRVTLLGYKVMYHPDVSIIHYRGASKGTRKESQQLTTVQKDVKKMVAETTVDSMLLFYNKHLRKKYPFIINFLVDGGLWILKKVRILLIR